jgi:hypothetical protein
MTMRETPLSADAKLISQMKLAELTVPGPLIRPVPGFTIGVPQGWLVRDCPGALFVMGPPDTFEGPWSNVTVKHERVLGDTTLEDVARSTLVQLRADYPDVEVLEATLVTFEQTHYVRTSTLTMPGWPEPINRSDSFVFAPGQTGLTGDLFQFSWLNAYEATGPYAELYAAMLATLHFT